MIYNAKSVLLHAGLVCLTCLCLLGTSVCGAPPSIESVWPPVGQRGTEFEVKIVGSELANVQELTFYSPHLSCRKVQVNSPYEVVATIAASDKCRLGHEPFRVLTKNGFSELRTIRVTPFPVVLEERTGDITEAMPLKATNVTVCGVLGSGEYDRYAVAMKAGQELSVEVDAVRLGGLLLDTVMSVLGPDGEMLERADDNPLFRQDPTLAFKAVQDGTHIIDVHESNYGGSENSFYAVHIGQFPTASVLYPAGGQIGSTVRLQNLGVAGDEGVLAVEIPSSPDQLRDFQLLSQRQGCVAPSAHPFRVSAFANSLEAEPNNQPNVQMPSVAVPVAFNGILQAERDVDWFAFEADTAHPLLIEAFANRIGSSADTLIAVLDSNLQTIASNDDWDSHDSRIEFHPPESGRYFLTVTDKLSVGASDAVYRIEMSHLKPSLTAFLPRPDRLSQQSQSIAVPQGNRALSRIGVQRELVDGDVRMEFIGLPTGVEVSPVNIPADQFWVPVVFESRADASMSGQLIAVKPVCASANAEVVGQFAQVVDLVAESADQLFQSARVNRLPFAVTPPVPFMIDLQQPTTSVAKNGTIDLVVTVSRRENFTGPVHVELPFLPPWVVAEPHIVIESGQDRALYRLEVREQAVPRSWPLVATARIDSLTATGDTKELDGREVASKIIELTIDSSPISGQFKNLAAEQGQTVSVQCLVEKTATPPTKLIATLEGLPNRVACGPVAFNPEGSTIDFQLQLEADAPIGQFNDVHCRLSGELNGQAVSFVVAANSNLQIAAPGKLLRNQAGAVLTPLESLRQQRSSSGVATADATSASR